MKVLDLFSGIGGFSLGLEAAGMETVAFCEIDKFCQKVLRKHWPDVPIYDDVRSLDYDGTIDLICGGYPCQPFSHAGKRQGAADDRHLWPAMFSLIQKHKPNWVIGENVAGHFDMGLDQVLSDLESENYECRTFIIPACAVNAPHRRDRLWIVANAKDVQRNVSEREYGCGERPQVFEPRNGSGENNASNDGSERGQRGGKESFRGVGGFSWSEDVRRVADYFNRPDIPEPLIRRGGNGVSQRLHALGNAVVPQIPFIIGTAIMQIEASYLDNSPD